MSLLHWACDRGNATMIDVLLANGADMESRDGEGQTPLHYGIVLYYHIILGYHTCVLTSGSCILWS